MKTICVMNLKGGAPLEAEVVGWYPIPQYDNDDEEGNSDAEN